MRMTAGVVALMVLSQAAFGQKMVIVPPQVTEDVLVNPGIGFMTFQRFNGDSLNPGTKWTEGYPIVYQPFHGKRTMENHPLTSLAYFRLYWKFLEPAQGQYRWELIDKALQTAGQRGQTLLLRIAPYGTGADNDVPDWYRQQVGGEPKLPDQKWRTNPEDPRYVRHFGGLIRALGQKYNGHPLLESVDVSIVGAWGEGAGSERLTRTTRQALVDSYLETFRKTDLIMLLTDARTNRYGLSKRNVGWRVDCLGDLGFFGRTWCHMLDSYPQGIIDCGMKDAWQKAPVSLEACGVMQHWKDKGWDVDYIIDQSLKWHISSFNGKSSAVPREWRPQVDRWLKKMGYRLALRKFTYPETAQAGGKLDFTSWWENNGVAPCYHPFRWALRLINAQGNLVLPTGAEIRSWLPGDNLYDSAVTIPAGTTAGLYDLDIGIVDEASLRPKVQLAIAGRKSDGWYKMGPIRVTKSGN